MRVYVSSLGCKLNQSEMDDLASDLARAGHQVVPNPFEAELCVLNTCAVTHVAAQKSRQTLRRLHRENPRAHLVVTGCYAEVAPGDLAGLPGVELVVGNEDKEALAERITGREAAAASLPAGGPPPERPPEAGVRPRGTGVRPRGTGVRTRALVRIQDGCDNTCSYCIVRLARGRQRSRPPAQVIADVQSRLAAGYKEVVLTGVHLGAYGRDGSRQSGINLWDLVARILAETDVVRLRLSSIEPWDLPERAFGLWGDPRLCRHLHLPLQSGCDATLERMARRYTAVAFERLVAQAREAIADLAVTTDLIVGFPGESGEEFAASLAFVQAMQFARVHVFPFSPRPGTRAAQMPGQVPTQQRSERAQRMREAAAQSSLAFRTGFIGRSMVVLWESRRLAADERLWSGLTDNYLRVYAPCEADLANREVPARLLSLMGDGLRGELGE
jgi:threonylcarbamoyladenosine tRNA methylthiotransferase MtaB